MARNASCRRRGPLWLALAVLLGPGCAGAGEPVSKPALVIEQELDRAESHAVAPRGTPHVSDLLRAQDMRITEQRLRTLQTRTPRSADLPVLERQLDRLQRPSRVQNF
jgi:hypothetical protein